MPAPRRRRVRGQQKEDDVAPRRIARRLRVRRTMVCTGATVRPVAVRLPWDSVDEEPMRAITRYSGGPYQV